MYLGQYLGQILIEGAFDFQTSQQNRFYSMNYKQKAADLNNVKSAA